MRSLALPFCARVVTFEADLEDLCNLSFNLLKVACGFMKAHPLENKVSFVAELKPEVNATAVDADDLSFAASLWKKS